MVPVLMSSAAGYRPRIQRQRRSAVGSGRDQARQPAAPGAV